MRLKHSNPDVTTLALPTGTTVEADSGGGFTVADEAAAELLKLPWWSQHDVPLEQPATRDAPSDVGEKRRNTRAKAPAETKAAVSVGGISQA